MDTTTTVSTARAALDQLRGLPAAASLAVRAPLTGPPRRARLVAVSPVACHLEFPESTPEPRVVVVAAPGTLRLPNAVAVKPPAGEPPLWRGGDGDPCPTARRPRRRAVGASGRVGGRAEPSGWAGGGRVVAGDVEIHVRRWWDPSPVLRPLSRARLEHGAAVVARAHATAEYPPGIDHREGLAGLAAACAAGDLADAVESAERLVGLGPGLVPSGDNVLCGLLVALRLLGGAVAGGTRAVWLADWLGAAVTGHSRQRTTPLGASLLHCAAHGQAAEEASAVLRGIAGQEPLEPAVRRLLAVGRHAGTELAWGLAIGCQSALTLSGP